MDVDEVVSGLILELRRGTLILLVLSQMKEPTYGYSLVKTLSDNQIPMDANTLYPLLRRLEGQGLLSSRWDTAQGKPRKYYQITEVGTEVLEKTKTYWKRFSEHVDNLLEGTVLIRICWSAIFMPSHAGCRESSGRMWPRNCEVWWMICSPTDAGTSPQRKKICGWC